MSNGTKSKAKIASTIVLNCHPQLKALAADKADGLDIPLSELAVRALADYLHAPASLRGVPRKKMGRPRKKIKV